MAEAGKVLVVYYSRSGSTQRLCEDVAQELGADIEGIQDVKSRKGLFGWLRSGYEASRRKLPEIRPFGKDPAQYDLVVLGTPVWAGVMASPMRTWLAGNKTKLKSVAFVMTSGGNGFEGALNEMAEYVGKQPKASLSLTAAEVKAGKYGPVLKIFAAKLK